MSPQVREENERPALGTGRCLSRELKTLLLKWSHSIEEQNPNNERTYKNARLFFRH